jgi:hypothetical protein
MRALRADGQMPEGALSLGRLFDSFAIDRVALDRFLAVMSFENLTS